MGRAFNIAAAALLFFAGACTAQENNGKASAVKDTAGNILKLYNDALRIDRDRQKFFDRRIPLLNNNRLLNQLYLGMQPPADNLGNTKLVQDPLSDFKKHLYKFLALQYGSIPNYDLGTIGKYLLLLKNFTAFYLAILSLL